MRLAVLFLIPAAARPLYDLDPRDVNPTPVVDESQHPLAPDAITVFSVSMSDNRACSGSQMLFGAYNTSSTGCLGTRGPGFGSMRVLLADNQHRACRARIYATANCDKEIGVADVDEEGVCVYSGMGQVAAGWKIECKAA
ncbi:hypothetical protein CcaverHIS002_0113090 [Cutaneotrichosporon cavernicola]|uniref:Uncharacterized protein n=1 Tax=Cutaneotrichosporon cavernicola TaxID=279322 RepID=A0AA48II84_9TREE|nr:uncharacterized protein CcaverHIS019_0112960 [Cutaneotrichosporon cavernicola]BEI80780.1 hypothetical protein CcaverHIS002_0113090 [Cutaneotrichosporon cavernicola]BEI88578.1 hypothetical protein CcaverHIS019_0112960 [Cutaneotrichosporon cavernicola]BEI96351.1 hypothetical protein CcaverHIS631_0113000 [Cutaneotrichosporon cavernicola]BEJ04123.1 hypothetical protein CcaverHIS641_0112980 [Cutaneotrichosporon cavernicola]